MKLLLALLSAAVVLCAQAKDDPFLVKFSIQLENRKKGILKLTIILY
jgi:hypothetical protein